MKAAVRVRADPDEVRARIIEVAEVLFRSLGYQKTSMADIAAELKMSPANLYRFFPSKLALVEQICARVTGEIQAVAWRIARSNGSASEKLERFAVELHRHNKSVLLKDRRLHDMVSIAMVENWQSIERHVEQIRGVIESIIREGVETGEFKVADPAAMALVVKSSFVAFLHPQLLEQCFHEDMEPLARGVARLVVKGLRAGD